MLKQLLHPSNDHLIPRGKITQRTADHGPAHPIGIHIGDVEEIDPQFQRALDKLLSFS
jgi:hypothetical protein